MVGNIILVSIITIIYFFTSKKINKVKKQIADKNNENEKILKKIQNSKIKNEALKINTVSIKKSYEELLGKYNTLSQTNSFKRAERDIYNEINN